MKYIISKVLYLLLFSYIVFFIPIVFGWKPLVVISGSMEPTLHVGSLLYYKNIDVSDIDKNDILVFRSYKHIVSHRVIENRGYGFVTKGDANNSNDSGIITNNQVLGVGTDWCIPFVGYYVDYIYNRKYLFVIIIVLIALSCVLRGKKYEET